MAKNHVEAMRGDVDVNENGWKAVERKPCVWLLDGYLPAMILLLVVSVMPLLDDCFILLSLIPNLNTGADAWVGIGKFC